MLLALFELVEIAVLLVLLLWFVVVVEVEVVPVSLLRLQQAVAGVIVLAKEKPLFFRSIEGRSVSLGI